MSDDLPSNDELSSVDSLENYDNNKENGADSDRRSRDLKNEEDEESDIELQFDAKGELTIHFEDSNERSITATTDSEKSTGLPLALNGNDEYYRLAFLDANHADCKLKITNLLQQVDHLRMREAALVQEVEILKKVIEDLQTQPPTTLFSAFDGSDLSCSGSPRSERSISSAQVNTLNIKYALDVFGENNRLLKEGIDAERKASEMIGKMQNQIDELKSNLKAAEERCQHLIEEYSDKETSFMEEICKIQKQLTESKHSFESLLAEKQTLSEQYNQLLMQKSNWQSKIDEFKTIRRSQVEASEENERLRLENENLNHSLKNANDKINDLTNNLTDSKSKLAEKVDEVVHFRKVLNEKSKESFKQEYDELYKRYKAVADENVHLAENLAIANAKLETLTQIERAFDTQNLGLSALKKSLDSKDANLTEVRKRCNDLEQVLDENLKEKEHKSKIILQLQEQLGQKSNDCERLEKDFDDWKINANAQFEHTCREYDEKIDNLHLILKKYTDYPGKVDSEKEDKVREVAALLEELDSIKQSVQENNVSFEEKLKKVEENAKWKYDGMCKKYEGKIIDIQSNLKKSQKDVGEVSNELDGKIKEVAHYRKTIEHLNNLLDEANANKEHDVEDFKAKLEEHCHEINKMWENKMEELEKTVTVLSERLAEQRHNHSEADRLQEINEMMEHIARLTVKCETSDLLHVNAEETIRALREQYDEERKLNEQHSGEIDQLYEAIEQLKRDKINALNEANISASIIKMIAERMNLRDDRLDISLEALLNNVDDVHSLKIRLAKMTDEKRQMHVDIYRQKTYRTSLICQKKYLLTIIERLKSTETKALNFMKRNGYSKGDIIQESPKLPKIKLRRCFSVVIASIRLMKKREKIYKYLNKSVLISPHPLSVSFG